MHATAASVPLAFDPDDMLVMQLVAQLVIGCVFGAVCAAMAPGRGRSGLGWFCIGFFFNCVGLIILLLIPNLKLEEEKQRRHSEETRRLREQLKKERQVADHRHDAHHARLGAHDRAIGVDTAPPGTAPAAGALPPPLPARKAAAAWFYAHDGVRHGPVPGSDLERLWLDQQIPDSTIVWREGMSDWRPIGEAADLLGDDRG